MCCTAQLLCCCVCVLTWCGVQSEADEVMVFKTLLPPMDSVVDAAPEGEEGEGDGDGVTYVGSASVAAVHRPPPCTEDTIGGKGELVCLCVPV